MKQLNRCPVVSVRSLLILGSSRLLKPMEFCSYETPYKKIGHYGRLFGTRIKNLHHVPSHEASTLRERA